MTLRTTKPGWLKTKPGGGERYAAVRRALRAVEAHTVCEEALCPNRGECWSSGTATFLILGDVCTRGCAFCSVKRGDPGGAIDPLEPERIRKAVSELGLDYVVVTSVTRDDLLDGGASIFAGTVTAIRSLSGGPLVEVLIPDFDPDPLRTVIASGPAVIAHNIEVVERLTPIMRHSRFSYRRSLEVLSSLKRLGFRGSVKSSILLGLGEEEKDIEASMRDLRDAGCDTLVLGQYLQPTRENPPPKRYVTPEEFDAWARKALDLGFEFAASAPLARTSYRAAEVFAAARNRS